jgi:hypothetical protein
MKKFTNIVTCSTLPALIFLISALIFGIASIHDVNSTQIALAENVAIKEANDTNNNLTTSAINTTSSADNTGGNISTTTTINLSTKEISDGVYNWINASNSSQNPTLKVFENTNNIINIQNPTDTKHDLIIDTGADNLPSSGDILPDSSGHLTFNQNTTGTFTYHCAYHPYTMKGAIEVIKK